MKKRFLLLGLIFAQITLAQTINLNQTGDGHAVNIHQQGDNLINIEQIYGINNVYIIQKGADNQIDILQDHNIETISSNFAEVLQNGEGNYGTIEQSAWSINNAYIQQSGDYNNAEIHQPWRDYSIGYNLASIYQNGSYNQFESVQEYQGNKIEATQFGNNNLIETKQAVSGILESGEEYVNSGYIWQEGDYNYAKLTQMDFNNKSYLTQIGSNNRAEQLQQAATGGEGSNTARITQEQNNAYASQAQSSGFGGSNYAEIYQRALDPDESNYTKQIQVGGGNRALAHTYHGDNNILQEQHSGLYGENNWTYVQQGGHFNETEIYQYGGDNAAYVQTYSYWSDHNKISVIQGIEDPSGMYDIPGGAYASVYVEGSDNIADIEQYGINNRIGTAQTPGGYGIEIIGNNNAAEIYQQGNDNYADLHLLGDGLDLRIEQIGNDMSTSITQEN